MDIIYGIGIGSGVDIYIYVKHLILRTQRYEPGGSSSSYASQAPQIRRGRPADCLTPLPAAEDAPRKRVPFPDGKRRLK